MRSHEDATPLECTIEVGEDTARVAPIGELDLDTVGTVEERLEEVRAAGVDRIVLDLRGTTFIDSTGLGLALAWQERANRERFSFGLIQGPRAVRRTIEVAGIGEALNFVE